MPNLSGSQKARDSSPRTPRYKGCFTSSSVATAASFRIAWHMWPTVAQKVSAGLRATVQPKVITQTRNLAKKVVDKLVARS
eukprot:CAMPEP_0115888834 /NCGR_PEP_ID=MMETSP0287-20121206/32511_1 /TAXON_ID=412157 /ORGANISM="Chrysochromulina rotalis, Strain UIO044" /LENGTH=80 /DNA_ID=CAMNT_0003345529 /DNA_START=727 /DNA_END=969 /DNA_ORIENTATION=+